MSKYVYLFKEGNQTMRNLLGGKGANLAEMSGWDFCASRIYSNHEAYCLL